MISLTNKQIEVQIEEILQGTAYVSAEKCLEARLAARLPDSENGRMLLKLTLEKEQKVESRGDYADAASRHACIAGK